MKVSAKGRITIPREIREKTGPEARMEAWIRKIRGTATTGLTTDEIMAMTRGED